MKTSECKSCGAKIYWLKTQSGKMNPVDNDLSAEVEPPMFDHKLHTSHFATCPQADSHRSAHKPTPAATGAEAEAGLAWFAADLIIGMTPTELAADEEAAPGGLAEIIEVNLTKLKTIKKAGTARRIVELELLKNKLPAHDPT